MGFIRKEQLSEEDRAYIHPCSPPSLYAPKDNLLRQPLFGADSVWQCDECGKLWVTEWDQLNCKKLVWERPYLIHEWWLRRKLKR